MFTRTAMMFGSRSQFAVFFKNIAPKLSHAQGPRRMKVAAALWRSTASRYGKSASKSRTDTALKLYKKHGNGVVTKAPKTGSLAVRRRSRRSSKKSAKKPSKKTVVRVSSKPVAYTDYRRAVRKGSFSKLSAAEEASLRALFKATVNIHGINDRVRVSRHVLQAVRKGSKHKKPAIRARRHHRRAVRSPVTRQRHRVHKKSSAPKVTPYRRFHQMLVKKGHLTKSKTLNTRVYSLWLLTGKQPRMSLQKRVDKALWLLKKTRRSGWAVRSAKQHKKLSLKKKSHKKRNARRRTSTKASHSPKKSVKKASKRSSTVKRKVASLSVKRVHRRRSPLKASKKLLPSRRRAAVRKSVVVNKRVTRSRRTAPARVAKIHTKKALATKPKSKKVKTTVAKRNSSHKNPYLKFYRAMMKTGEVPYFPRRARSKRIKELWSASHHLDSLSSRIKYAESVLSGKNVPPQAHKPVAVSSAARNIKKVARTVKPPTSHPSSSAISFRVPDNYERNPFAATYSVLGSHAYGADSDARMHTVARAWMETTVPGKDTRTPRERIEAVARVMRRRPAV